MKNFMYELQECFEKYLYAADKLAKNSHMLAGDTETLDFSKFIEITYDNLQLLNVIIDNLQKIINYIYEIIYSPNHYDFGYDHELSNTLKKENFYLLEIMLKELYNQKQQYQILCEKSDDLSRELQISKVNNDELKNKLQKIEYHLDISQKEEYEILNILEETKARLDISNKYKNMLYSQIEQYQTELEQSKLEEMELKNKLEELKQKIKSKNTIYESKVDFSAIAPKQLVKGEGFIINIVMYEKEFRDYVDEVIKDYDCPVKESKKGRFTVEKKRTVKILLHSNDIEIDDNEDSSVWEGEYLNFNFSLYLSENYQKNQIQFFADVYVDDVILTQLKFFADISAPAQNTNLSIYRHDIMSAFISYASQDRARVASIVQGMQAIRPEMNIFFDIDKIQSGDYWEDILKQSIDESDILYLCWSDNARKSEWVYKEWKYSFDSKGIESIEPIPIEPPDVCPPPEELKSKHFNSRLIYIIEHYKNNNNISN